MRVASTSLARESKQIWKENKNFDIRSNDGVKKPKRTKKLKCTSERTASVLTVSQPLNAFATSRQEKEMSFQTKQSKPVLLSLCLGLSFFFLERGGGRLGLEFTPVCCWFLYSGDPLWFIRTLSMSTAGAGNVACSLA